MPTPNLRPLPMRITQLQYERLVARRSIDHIAIQEHVRRALDVYLDGLDRKARSVPPPAAPPSPATVADAVNAGNAGDAVNAGNAGVHAADVAGRPKRKLVYR
jgi:hypothetical protein